MADLHNLLGELEEPDEPEVPSDTIEQEEPIRTEEDTRERPEVPLALAEAEKNQFRPIPDDFSDVDVDALGKEKGTKILFDDEIDGDEDDGAVDDVDYAQLKRVWKQELNCPELLFHDSETIGLHKELLEGQEESIDKLLDQASGSRPSSASSKRDSNLASLVTSIYKVDADRVRFMLTDLARTRLGKIEDHALHMRGLVDRMSEEEISYLKQYGELLERHLRRTVLDHLPKDAWKNLDEPYMIDSPDLDEFVFCKVMETVEIDNRDPEADEDADEAGGDSIQEHQTGACLIARYSAVKDLVAEGKIELLM